MHSFKHLVRNAASILFSMTAIMTTSAQDCTITIPSNFLTAQGLSTPLVVTGCSQRNATTFAHGVILDLDTGIPTVYNPLVIDASTPAAFPPTVPQLPTNNIVAVWFGTNGNSLTLRGTGASSDSLVQSSCVNGGGNPYSIFGRSASCNARAFFDAANIMIAMGALTITPSGNDFTGSPCPTSRDFGLVDQNPSDGTLTTYLLTSDNKIAQNIPANVAKIANSTKTSFTITNMGDHTLLSLFLNPVIGCPSIQVTDLADPKFTQTVPSLVMNELQARLTAPPVAFIPADDPMVHNTNLVADLDKLNAYRYTVNQTPVRSLTQAQTISFCRNMYRLGSIKIVLWLPRTLAQPFGPAQSLGEFMIQRFNTAVGPTQLACASRIGAISPLNNLVDANGKIVPTVYNTLIGLTATQLATALNVNTIAIALDTQIGEASTDPVGTQPPQQQPQQQVSGGTGIANALNWTSFGIGLGATFGGLLVLVVIVYCIRKDQWRPANNSFKQTTQFV